MFTDRVTLALSESFLTFNIRRVVFENFDLENWCEYGSETNSVEVQY